jgi:hypothetical protein
MVRLFSIIIIVPRGVKFGYKSRKNELDLLSENVKVVKELMKSG